MAAPTIPVSLSNHGNARAASFDKLRTRVAFAATVSNSSDKPRSTSRQKRIALAFLADGAHGAVAADEDEVVAERQELGLDGVDQGGVVAVGEVGAADGAAKQHVADEREALRGIDQHHRAR